MDEGKTQAKRREVTAREWLFWLGVGLVVALIAASIGNGALVGIGVLVAVVAGFGIAWRVLANR